MKTNYELLKLIERFDNLDDFIKEILKIHKNIKIGHIYEWVSNICISFGMSKYGKDIKMLSGNAQDLVDFTFNLDTLTINEGSVEGISDIKFIKNDINKLIEMEDYEGLLNYFTKLINPTKGEQKKRGEVFTPLELVNEMLDKLPKKVWSNPDLKWFDPANGIGNFPVCVFIRLMKGLESVIPDKEDRKKHILEKMLYVAELDRKNCFIYNLLMSEDGKYKLNIYQGNSLELDIHKQWEIESFDIIMGNPPYQKTTNGVSSGGGNGLFLSFINFSFKNLNENGYLIFINPPSFFSIGRSLNNNEVSILNDIFMKNNILYMNIEECKKFFPKVGSKFCYYILQKSYNEDIETNVICSYNNKVYDTKLNLKNNNFLPYLISKESLSIAKKILNTFNKLKIFHSPDNRCDKKHVIKTKDNNHKYPIQATSKQIVYSNKECKWQYNKKILMSRSGYLKPFYDDGIIGIGGDCFSCLVENKEEGEYIINLINSKLYTFFIEIYKWSGFHHRKILQQLPYIKLENLNDENIYKYFNLTHKEINLIEEIIN